MNGLEIYVVYDNPSDYPGQFVVRRNVVAKGLHVDVDPICVVDSLEEARGHIPQGLVMIPRMIEDDACIHEVWL